MATFNYDTLLERALESQNVGFEWRGSEGHVKMLQDETWQVVKLHGSANWSRIVLSNPLDALTNYDGAIQQAHKLDLESGKIVATSAIDYAKMDGYVAVPCVAVPTSVKSFYECPIEHQDRFKESIGKVDRLLIVGWKGAEAHVAKELAGLSNMCKVGIVDTKAGMREVRENLASMGVSGNRVRTYDRGFTTFIRERSIFEWLHWATDGD